MVHLVPESTVDQFWLLVELNIYHTLPTDDATTSPHQCDGTIIKLPSKLFCCLSHEHETLSIRHNFGGIQSLEHTQKKIGYQK